MYTDRILFRAQVQGVHGRWVDGGLFERRALAEAEAQRLGNLYDRPVRVLEELHQRKDRVS